MEKDGTSDTGEQATERSVPAQAHAGINSEWERVEQTFAFKELVRRKKAFIIPVAIFFFVFIMLWLILANFTTILDGQAVGELTWAYVYGLANFPLGLILLHLFLWQAKKWDRLVEEARREASNERREA